MRQVSFTGSLETNNLLLVMPNQQEPQQNALESAVTVTDGRGSDTRSTFPVGRPKKLGNTRVAELTILTIELMKPEAGKGQTANGYFGTE